MNYKNFASIILISLITCISSTLHAKEGLSETESALVFAVDGLMETAKSDLEQVVNINSGTMNFDGVKQVGMVFKKQLDELGFATQWQDGAKFDRAGHLVAEYLGERAKTSKKILLIGHLDTVFSPTDSFQEYTALDQQYSAGPGITDMKGGNVIIVTVMRALKQADLLDDLNIRIVLTGDEENSGSPLSLSKQAIVDGAKWADIALGFEDGDGQVETAVIARRGSIGWSIEVQGKPAHSSQIFREEFGYGAIFEAARILNQFRLQLADEQYLTFNPGVIVAGTRAAVDRDTSDATAFGKDNVIAQTAKIYGDIRTISPEQLAHAKETMEAIVNDNLAQTTATIRFEDGYPSMPPTDNNRKLLAVYSQISEQLGYGRVIAVDPRRAGAADISFAAEYVDMALDGLGLMGTGGHTKDEVADMNTLVQNSRKAALLIYRASQTN